MFKMFKYLSPAPVEETDSDVIAQQAYAELESEKNGTPLTEKKKLDTEEEKPSEEKPSDDASKPSEESEKEKTVEGQEEAKPGEEKPKEEEPKLGADGKPIVEEKKEATLDSATINDYAVENNLTYAEAKEELVKTAAIIEKYKGDPKEMAKALRNVQSGYDKLKSKVEEKPKTQVFQRLTDQQFLVECKANLEKDKEKFVDTYRNRFPAKSEMMSDEAIIEELAERGLAGYKQFADAKENELVNKATERRDELLNSLTGEDKKFLPDVKSVLAKTAHQSILDPDFDVKDIVRWAKGGRYEEDLKAAYDRGVKAGKEGAVIIGAKDTIGSQTTKTTSTASAGLNADQKKRAEEMFTFDDGYSPEKAHEMFKDTFKEELKKNPKYV